MANITGERANRRTDHCSLRTYYTRRSLQQRQFRPASHSSRPTAGCSWWRSRSFPFSARVSIALASCIKKPQMGFCLCLLHNFRLLSKMGVRFATHFREIQLRATKTSTPTDAGIDVIHSLVKCLTQNEVPPPSPPSVRIYAFRLLTHWLSRRPGPLPVSLCRFWPPFNVIIIHFMSC